MKLRYLPSIQTNYIFNFLHPFNITAWNNFPDEYKNKWWEDETINLREKFSIEWINYFDNITKHYTNLKNSIEKEGIKSPICLVSGNIPSNSYFDVDTRIFKNNNSATVHTRVFGGSRLHVASILGIYNIPAVIYDYNNKFDLCEEINRSNFGDFFNPKEYFWSDTIPYIRIKIHSHIDDINYKSFNMVTKKVQQDASKHAIKILNLKK